ncbi:MAG: ZIP family metal transporter [Betaproteobacteria bacterium]|nr:ZIP family metal transporter [Betaproteobacteria bacterium]
MTLLHIIAATLIAGVLSTLAAALLSLHLLSRITKRLVSLSAGLLLGAASIDLLPEAIASGEDPEKLGWTLGLGFLGFFLLEKFAILRHGHHHEGDGHEHHQGHDRHEAGPEGLLILVGDSLHNFVDGVLIASAFLVDHRLGWMTALAVAAHEIPQEIGDYIVLINARYSRQRAIVYNMISGLAAVIGGLAGWALLSAQHQLLPYLITLSAAAFIYVALADLVPDMHKQRQAAESFVQLGLIGLGVLAIMLAHRLVHPH